MTFENLTRGSVIFFPFLWWREAERGETEGRKGRETVIVSRFTFEGKDHIALLPITASLAARAALWPSADLPTQVNITVFSS